MVDKVLLTTQDFYIKDVRTVSSGFKVAPAETCLTTGEQNNQLLFRDQVGKSVVGRRAYYNNEHDLYQLTIDSRGLMVQFNPSKPYHPYHLVANEKELMIRSNRVISDLANRGIILDEKSLTVSRLDLTKNVEVINPVSCYGTAFRFLNMKRTSRQVIYPDGFSAGNKSWGVIFYDKLEEISRTQKMNSDSYIMRGENQLKKTKAVQAMTGITNLTDLYQVGFDHLGNVYRGLMRDRVFRMKQQYGEQLTIFSIDDEVRYLSSLRNTSGKKAINSYLISLGIPAVVQGYGSLELFGHTLIKAGFSRKTVWERVKKLHEDIHLRSLVRNDGPMTVTAMYKELCLKFAA